MNKILSTHYLNYLVIFISYVTRGIFIICFVIYFCFLFINKKIYKKIYNCLQTKTVKTETPMLKKKVAQHQPEYSLAMNIVNTI